MAASPLDEFEDYRQRAFNNGRRQFRSRDDAASLSETQLLQARMRMRASFRSESASRPPRRHHHEQQEALPERLAAIGIGGQRAIIGDSVVSVFGSHDEIDCDFPSSDDKRTSSEPDDDDDDVDDDVMVPAYGTPRGVLSPVRHGPVSPPHRPHHLPMSPSPPAHHRSNSCRVRTRRPRELQQRTPNGTRRRTYSMPSRTRYRRPRSGQHADGADADGDGALGESPIDESGEFYRVRTFSTSSKGIVNRGDSFKRKPLSAQSSVDVGSVRADRPRTLSATSQDSSVGSASDVQPHRALVMGGGGVGKTSLLRQFMTSEYMGNVDTVLEDQSSLNVSILLDGVESLVEFIDVADAELVSSYGAVDAYVVIYALNDRESFDDAIDCLHELRKKELLGATAAILVANKSDIVRGREVEEQEGKVMAVRYCCKYIEVSAVLNLKVDELLVGIVKQIRLNDKRKAKRSKRGARSSYCLSSDDTGCLPQSRSIMGKIFRKTPYVFRSCDNLLVL